MHQQALGVDEFVKKINSDFYHSQGKQIIRGEICSVTDVENAKNNLYFSIRDINNEQKCVIFRESYKQPNPIYQKARSAQFQEGMNIQVEGTPQIFNCNFQFRVDNFVLEEGSGAFVLNKEKILQKYREFQKRSPNDPDTKEIILKNSLKAGDIAIVGAKGSNGVSDVIKILQSANYKLWYGNQEGKCLFDAPMQNPKDCHKLVEALQNADSGNFKFIILCRGGGSDFNFEIFNQEMLIECLTKMKTPVVSALGHSRDHCLADSFATYKATTPTDAANLLVRASSKFFYTQQKQKMIIGAIITAILFIILWAVF